MRRLELLIDDARRETENEEFSDSIGIDDLEFIRYANDAQKRLQSLIYQRYQKIFMGEKDIDAVANQQNYDLPYDIYLETAVSRVRYKSSNVSDTFFKIEKASLRQLNSDFSGFPSYYIRLGSQILLNPKPQQSGTIRVNYIRRLDTLDIRRAKIDSVTTVGNSITALTLDTTETIDRDELVKYNRFCVVDKDGAQTMRRIEFDDIDDGTGVVTITSGFEFEDGETITAGDYLVSGDDSANMSELPDTCERYLISYMNWKIFKRDSSNDSQEAFQEIQALEAEILSSFAEADDEITFIPIEDHSFIDEDFH